MQVTPARMKERMIAGPESPIASPRITKMPVPMTAPMPSAVRSSRPTARLSELLSSWVSATSLSTGLVSKRPPRCATPMSAPRSDHHYRPPRALHELQRDISEHPPGDAPARARADHDQVRVMLLGEQQDPGHDLPGPDRGGRLHAALPDLRGEPLGALEGRAGVLLARQRGERLHLDAVDAHDLDRGASVLGQLGRGVRHPWLLRSRLGGHHDPLHPAPPCRRSHENSPPGAQVKRVGGSLYRLRAHAALQARLRLLADRGPAGGHRTARP